MEAGRVDLVIPGLGFKLIITNFYRSYVISYKLAVLFTSGNVKRRVHCYFFYWQDHIIFLVSVCGSVPLSADNFRLSPRHLHSLRIGATVLSLSTETGAHVGTATVGNQSALLRLADVNTVGTRD